MFYESDEDPIPTTGWTGTTPVGDNRFLCRIDDEEIIVLVVTVANRRDVYR